MQRKAWIALANEAIGLDAPTIERRIRNLYQADIPDIESLRSKAYNDVLTESGRGSEVEPFSGFLNWLFSAIA
ncbi:MAG: hypothetical protein LBK01_00060 [Burkholderiaceae bacterium]|nr:hypothetical protein [Burkholderiaceae bacterium]